MRAKAQLLSGDFVGQSVWGWKDPRNCLTLPFWQSLLPHLKTIIIIRNPLEVAYSMHKRNGTSLCRWIAALEKFITAGAAGAYRSRTNASSLNYAAFLRDPQSELRKGRDLRRAGGRRGGRWGSVHWLPSNGVIPLLLWSR